MIFDHPEIRSSVALVLVLGVAGCAGSPDVGNRGPLPVGLDADPRLEAAMAGLRYEGDRVLVDPDWPVAARGHEAAVELITLGNRLLEVNRSTEAVRAFSDAVLAAPGLADAYHGLARALFLARKRNEALAAYYTTLALDDGRLDARHGAAATLQSLGRLGEAVELWSEVIRRDPTHGRSHARLAVGYYLLGDLASARIHAAEADALGAPMPAQLEMLLATGKPPSAVIRQAPAEGEGSVTIGPQIRIETAATGALVNETTASAAVGTSLEVVAGWNDWREPGTVRAGVSVSNDGGATWTDFLLRAPVGHQNAVEGDPMTAFDPTTGTLWAGGVTYFNNNPGMWVARKRPGLAEFEEPVMTIEHGAADKGWMATGPEPGNPGAVRLYLAFNLGLQYSTDMGDTWSSLLPLGSGWGHLPRVGPAGEVYVAFWDANDSVMVQRSLDGGSTAGPPVRVAFRMDNTVTGDSFPGGFRVWPFSYIAVDPNDGTVYCVWFDVTEIVGSEKNVDLYMSRSFDSGDTWSTPKVINGDSDPPGDQFFPWIEVDSNGRLHLFFFDTRNTPQSDLDFRAWIDAYYSYSDDGGDTWTEHVLTPAPFDSSLAPQRFLGDYCGMALAENHAFPVYLSTQNGGPEIFTHDIEWDSSAIFADGFESGDTSAWSLTVE